MERKQKIDKRLQGFSLIEVVFSVGLFTVGIFAVVGLMNQEILKSMNRRDESIAGQLAQEGIELVRNIRDNNWLDAGANAFDGIPTPTSSGTIDYQHADSVAVGGSFYLALDANNFYQHSGATNVFSRRIIVEPDGSKRKITSVVAWNGQSPPSSNLKSDCTPIKKCFYIEMTLDDTWGKVAP